MTRHHPHVVLRDDQTVLLAVLRAAVESATSSPGTTRRTVVRRTRPSVTT